MGHRSRVDLEGPVTGAGRVGRSARAAALGSLLAAGGILTAVALARQTLLAWPGAGAVSPEAALLAVVLAAATLLCSWVAVVLALAVLDLLRDRPGRARRPGPASPHLTVGRVSALLVALTAGPTPVALAGAVPGPPEPSWVSVRMDATPPPSTDQGTGQGRPQLPDGSPVPLPGWTPPPPPARTDVRPTTIGLVSPAPPEEPPGRVVVRAGDTLWAIAAAHLGPHATVRDVAEAWPRWYAANRDVIGPDPDLILPGQELQVPGSDAATGEDAGR